MKTNLVLLTTLLVGIVFSACEHKSNNALKTLNQDTITNKKPLNMKSYISVFEIPATDITRAINFYQAILDIKIEQMDMPEMQMGILPYEGEVVTGVIIKADGYKPSTNGVTIYLNGGDNLQEILNKVEKNGGKILTTKTPHADGIGFWAHFLDSEGNKMGLSSPN